MSDLGDEVLMELVLLKTIKYQLDRQKVLDRSNLLKSLTQRLQTVRSTTNTFDKEKTNDRGSHWSLKANRGQKPDRSETGKRRLLAAAETIGSQTERGLSGKFTATDRLQCSVDSSLRLHHVGFQGLWKGEWNTFLDPCNITVCNLRIFTEIKVSSVS